MNKLIIDRFEGDLAVCEDENKVFKNIPISTLPNGVKEGTCLIIDNGFIKVDNDLFKKRTAKIANLMNNLIE